MKIIALVCLLLAAAGRPLRADFFSPFADAKVGSTVTSTGEIVLETSDGGAAVCYVRFGTDTGPRRIPAEIAPELTRQKVAGRPAKITATIRERTDPKSKAKVRYLEVLKVEFLN